MESIAKQIEYLLSLEIDELKIQVGQNLIGKSAINRTNKELSILSEKYLQQKKHEIRDNLCNSKIKQLLTDSRENTKLRVDAILTIADVVAGFTIGIPPFVLTVLIIKIGLNEFCNAN